MGTWASALHLAYPFCNTCRVVFLCSFVCLFGMGSQVLRLASNSLSCYKWPWTWVLLPLPLEWQDCRYVPPCAAAYLCLTWGNFRLREHCKSSSESLHTPFTQPFPLSLCYTIRTLLFNVINERTDFSGHFISFLPTSFFWSRPSFGLQLQLFVHPFQISTAGCETALSVGLDPASNHQVLVIGVIVMSFLLRRWVPSTCTQKPMWGQCWRKWILVYIRTAVRMIIIVQGGSLGRERRVAHFTHLFLQPWKKYKREMLPTLVLRMQQEVQGRPISLYS